MELNDWLYIEKLELKNDYQNIVLLHYHLLQ